MADPLVQRVPDDAIWDCDFCGKPMSFEEYATHQCEGLRGLNPWEEKLRGADWKPSAEMRARGTVVDGKPLTPQSVFDPEAKLRRRAKIWAYCGVALVFFLGFISGMLW